MTNNNSEIIAMYENLGMSPEEISLNEGHNLAAIKLVLLQGSVKYREDEGSNAAPNPSEGGSQHISDEEEKLLWDAYKHIAFCGEVEGVRAKVIRDCLNEKYGRNDISKLLKNGGNVNVVVINDAITKTREVLRRVKDKQVLEMKAA